jgi:hypothetical protein
MAQRKLAAKWTLRWNVPFVPFQNQRPNYNNHATSVNPQQRYNLLNAPLSMSNTLVPMDLGRARAQNDWRA